MLRAIFILFFCLIPLSNLSAQIIEFETHWDVYGDFNLDNLSRTVRLPGDITGDGIPDLVLGSFGVDSTEGANDNRGLLRAISGADGSIHWDVYGPFAFDMLFSPDILPGDLNGDGVPDLLASGSAADSTSGANDNVGIVMAISGADGSTIFTSRGDFSSDNFGGNNIFVGNLNGDSTPDIVANASNADTGEGIGDDVGLIRALNGTNGIKLFDIKGDFTDDRLVLKILEDINNDSVPDIISSTVSGDSSEGAGDSVGYVKANNGTNGALIFKRNGTFEGDQIGHNVLVLDDVSGNTNKEILVGSFLADTSSAVNDSIGEVMVVDGSTGGVVSSLRGPCSGDKYGQSIFVTEDLNNDNVKDYVMSTPEADSTGGCSGDNKGVLIAFSGATQTPLHTKRGDFTNDRLGETIVLQDITGDGVPDILVGVEEADSSEGANDNVGLVRAFHGVTGNTIFSSYGPFSQDKLGEQVVVVSDLTGDGLPDVLAASSIADSSEGANDNVGLLRAINSSTGATIFEVRGDEAGDELGAPEFNFPTIVETPDFNLDGVADILVSAQEASNPENLGTTQGVVKLISGKDGTLLFNLYGDFSLDRQGDRILLPGDLNNDGVTNIVACTLGGDSASAANDNVGSCKAITLEQCPSDPNKTGPGQCGCGNPDTDDDGDGTANCNDQCPDDGNKVAPLICGCGVADIDSDSDGTLDCNDQCPNDTNKVAPLVCGCGVADIDADNNGVLDCNESGSGDSGGDDSGGSDDDEGDVNILANQLKDDLITIKKNVKKLFKQKGRGSRIKTIKRSLKSLKSTDIAAILLILVDSDFALEKTLKKIRRASKKAIKTAKRKQKRPFVKQRKVVNRSIKQTLNAF